MGNDVSALDDILKNKTCYVCVKVVDDFLLSVGTKTRYLGS